MILERAEIWIEADGSVWAVWIDRRGAQRWSHWVRLDLAGAEAYSYRTPARAL